VTKADETTSRIERNNELAANCPDWARPYCHTHKRFLIWVGVWACPQCNPYLKAGRTP